MFTECIQLYSVQWIFPFRCIVSKIQIWFLCLDFPIAKRLKINWFHKKMQFSFKKPRKLKKKLRRIMVLFLSVVESILSPNGSLGTLDAVFYNARLKLWIQLHLSGLVEDFEFGIVLNCSYKNNMYYKSVENVNVMKSKYFWLDNPIRIY